MRNFEENKIENLKKISLWLTMANLCCGIGVEDFRCQPCNKSLSSLTRLKRHIQNVHMRPSREPVCNICKRVYSSLNSLRNHKSIYHRNVKDRKTAEDIIPSHPFYHHLNTAHLNNSL